MHPTPMAEDDSKPQVSLTDVLLAQGTWGELMASADKTGLSQLLLTAHQVPTSTPSAERD